MSCLVRQLLPESFSDSRGTAYSYKVQTFCGASFPLSLPQTGYPSPVTFVPMECVCPACFDVWMHQQVQQGKEFSARKAAWLEMKLAAEERHAAEQALAYINPGAPEQPKS